MQNNKSGCYTKLGSEKNMLNEIFIVWRRWLTYSSGHHWGEGNFILYWKVLYYCIIYLTVVYGNIDLWKSKQYVCTE